MEGRAFDERWSALPLRLRAQLLFLIQLYVLYLFLFGTRETLAENIAVEDLPSSKEILFADEGSEKLDSLLVDERDRRLIDSIAKLHDAGWQDAKTVGVIYGATHMRNVISFLLDRLNYRVAEAEWVTVFDL
jgi:pheromone shutdown protein TraB